MLGLGLGVPAVAARRRGAGGGGGEPSGPTENYLNPSDKGANITLTNSNRTLQKSGFGYESVRSIDFRTSGKFYLEVEFTAATTGSSAAAGFGTSAASLTQAPGANNLSIRLSKDGLYRHSSNQGGTAMTAIANGARIGFALDLDNRKIWFRSAAGVWNPSAAGTQNPETNAGGFTFPATFTGDIYAMHGVQTTADFMTVSYHTSEFLTAAPSGFEKFQI